MCPNPKFPADLVTFTEEILKGKLNFLCSVMRALLWKRHTIIFPIIKVSCFIFNFS